MHPADQGKNGAVAGSVALAANDDHGPAEAAPVEEAPGGESGWDAFEVWRTRVRDPRRAATDLTAD